MAPKASATTGKLRSSTSSSLTSSKPKSAAPLKRSNSLTGAFSSAKSSGTNVASKKKSSSVGAAKVKSEQIDLSQGADESDGEESLDPNMYKGLLKESKKKMGPAIHAEDWTDLTIILRVFDADLEYGPCSNTSRLERYERAVKLGLNPPPEIGEILTSKIGRSKREYAQSTFDI